MGTTSEKLTYLNTTKTLIKEELNLGGANITNEPFRAYKDKLEGIYKDFLANGTDTLWNNWLPKVTGSGTEISLNNTIEAKMDFVYKGNTSQKTTTGKNLFNSIYYKNQEIYTETISISTGDLYCTKLYLKPNTTYTISEALNNWTLTGAWIFVIADTNNQIIRYLQNRPQDYQTNPTTFTTNSDGYIYIGHRYGFTVGATDRMLAFLDTVNIQIEEGNTATSFEEYTNGASPNPDYPQDIQVVSGDNTIKVEGKNLFNASIQEGTFKNTTYTVASDGKITQSSSDDSGWGSLSRQFTLKSGTYTISLTNKPSTSYIQLRNITDGNDLVTTNNDSATFTINDTKIVAFKTYSMSGTYPISYYVQLEKGSTATTYTPYESQTYEIDLRTSKNLFDISTITRGYELNSNTGGIQVNANWWISNYIGIKPNTDYTSSNISSLTKCWYDSNKNFISRVQTTTGTSPSNARYLRVNGTLASIESNPNLMIEEGNTATTYQAYSSIELCKIGDYQDKIYKENGKWYLHKEIGKAVLDGSESWSGGAITGNYLYIYTGHYDSLLKRNYIHLGLATYFKVLNEIINTNSPEITTDSMSLGSDQPNAGNMVRIKINKTTANTIANFTTWLSTHNTIVYYVLATPTTTEITDSTLISQLEAIKKSYNNQTNISQENSKEAFILDVTALGN